MLKKAIENTLATAIMLDKQTSTGSFYNEVIQTNTDGIFYLTLGILLVNVVQLGFNLYCRHVDGIKRKFLEKQISN